MSDGIQGNTTATESMNVITNGPGQNKVSAQLNSSSAQLNFLGVPNSTYSLKWTPSLTSPANWIPLATNTISASGLLTFTSPSSRSNDFFRMKAQP
jgi:hypothetical protein